MNKKIPLGAAIAFMAIIAAATFSITRVYSMQTFNDKVYSIKERESMYSKVAEIDRISRQNYVEPIDENELMDSVAAGFVNGLGDQYSQYIDAQKYAAMQKEYGGKSVSIGIVTKMDESGYILISEVYPDSPAQAAGIEAGDLIIKVDDLDVKTDNYSEAVAMLRGEPGTKMTIVLRKGVEDITLEMTRRFVEVPSVNSMMLENNVGMIVIKEFNDNTLDQFNKQVDRLIDEGALALIFDVRGTSSGTLRSVTQVLDRLLPEGPLVYSIDKNGNSTILETSDSREVQLPMTVLVNEKTSGEAELFAAVIRDYQKGWIVGVKTVGKGSMQTTFPLTDGSAIQITTAKYKPPVSPSYDGEGVKPDYEVKITEEQQNLVDTLGVANDPQVSKALEIAVAALKQLQSGDNAATSSQAAASSSNAADTSSSIEESSSQQESSSEQSSEETESQGESSTAPASSQAAA